jgi:tRNA pseudouridine38-40 synthase
MPLVNSPQPARQPQTWKLTLAYDGTDFHGWQVQPGLVTVQGELQAALGRITGERPLPQGSGRTDAGVHALAQVASFVLEAPIPAENLMRALNRTLPAAIRVTEAGIAPDGFHARYSAVAKTYEYRIFRERICPPFLARYVHHCIWPLDLEELVRAAQALVGEQDFFSFAATDPELAARSADEEPPTAVRTVFLSAWERRPSEGGELLVYRVRGNGFLHHMVRNLVGTMLEVGRGMVGSEEIPRIIAARSRSAAGPTAPARGLFLHSVKYAKRDGPRTE